MNKTKKLLLLGSCLLLAFGVFTLVVKTVDVKAIGPQNSKVGLASVNGWFREQVGHHPAIYELTEKLGYGVLMVLVFALFRWSKPIQLLLMVLINVFWMKGLGYPVEILGWEWFLPRQAFAVLSLIPIWLYNGEQGPYNRTIRRTCYAFYPAHILILTVIGMFVLN